MKSTISKGKQEKSNIRYLLRNRNKVESAMLTIIAACDEAISANNAGMDMTWYEANVAFAVANAMKVLGFPQTLSKSSSKDKRKRLRQNR